MKRKSMEAAHDEFLPNYIPPGMRFSPTSEELIVNYLKKKVLGEKLPPNNIKVVDLYKYHPRQLEDMCKYRREKEMYFFTSREKKYPKGNRPNRTTPDGYWKASGSDGPISSEGLVVGHKRVLVFIEGLANGKKTKTKWIMHEFRVKDESIGPPKRDPNDMKLDAWVLCMIRDDSRNVDANSGDDHQNDLYMGIVPHEEILPLQSNVGHQSGSEFLALDKNPQQLYCHQDGSLVPQFGQQSSAMQLSNVPVGMYNYNMQLNDVAAPELSNTFAYKNKNLFEYSQQNLGYQGVTMAPTDLPDNNTQWNSVAGLKNMTHEINGASSLDYLPGDIYCDQFDDVDILGPLDDVQGDQVGVPFPDEDIFYGIDDLLPHNREQKL